MLKDYESGHCDRRMILFKAKQIGEAAFRESVRYLKRKMKKAFLTFIFKASDDGRIGENDELQWLREGGF